MRNFVFSLSRLVVNADLYFEAKGSKPNTTNENSKIALTEDIERLKKEAEIFEKEVENLQDKEHGSVHQTSDIIEEDEIEAETGAKEDEDKEKEADFVDTYARRDSLRDRETKAAITSLTEFDNDDDNNNKIDDDDEGEHTETENVEKSRPDSEESDSEAESDNNEKERTPSEENSLSYFKSSYFYEQCEIAGSALVEQLDNIINVFQSIKGKFEPEEFKELLPQNNPRFVAQRFVGGHWTNPFYEEDKAHGAPSIAPSNPFSVDSTQTDLAVLVLDNDLLAILERQRLLAVGIIQQVEKSLENPDSTLSTSTPLERVVRSGEPQSNYNGGNNSNNNGNGNNNNNSNNGISNNSNLPYSHNQQPQSPQGSRPRLSHSHSHPYLRPVPALTTEERNVIIVTTVHGIMNTVSGILNLLEAIDFSVFKSIRRSSTIIDQDGNEIKQDSNYIYSLLFFSYPVLIEFFEVKQLLYDNFMELVMSCQTITMEDPDMVRTVSYSDTAVENVIAGVSSRKEDVVITVSETLSLIDIDALLLQSCLKLKNNLKQMVINVSQLIEERDALVNYTSRAMNSDFGNLVTENNQEQQDDESIDKVIPVMHTNPELSWFLQPDYENQLLFDRNGENVKAGPKFALIERLTHHDFLDSNFNKVMLLTLQSIMSPIEFFEMLVSRFTIQPPEGLSYQEFGTWRERKQIPIRLRVINILRTWLESYWVDTYIDEEDANGKKLITSIKEFLTPLLNEKFPVARLLKYCNMRMQGKEINVGFGGPTSITHFDMPPPPPIFPRNIKKVRLLDIDPLEMARQMTIRDCELFSHITPMECLHRCWSSKHGKVGSTRHVVDFINNSTKLTNWVSYIVLRQRDIKKRVAVIRYFIMVAEKCRRYNNFSSMTAILTALCHSTIHRLKKTWTQVSPKTMSSLESMNKLMNSARNFGEYRDLLNLIHPPCVPFFGVFLTDLIFIESGNSDFYLGNPNMIHFGKRVKIFNLVQQIQQYQVTRYNLQEISEIQDYLSTGFDASPPIDDQYELSLSVEPRDRPTNAAYGSIPYEALAALNIKNGNNSVYPNQY